MTLMIDNDMLRWLILQLWAHDEIYKTDMTIKRDDDDLYIMNDMEVLWFIKLWLLYIC